MYRNGSHTQYDIEYHIVWTTKYRYRVIEGKVVERLRELLRQGCEAKGITIIKGRSSRLLQEEFKELKKRYWGHTYGHQDIFVEQ